MWKDFQRLTWWEQFRNSKDWYTLYPSRTRTSVGMNEGMFFIRIKSLEYASSFRGIFIEILNLFHLFMVTLEHEHNMFVLKSYHVQRSF